MEAILKQASRSEAETRTVPPQPKPPEPRSVSFMDVSDNPPPPPTGNKNRDNSYKSEIPPRFLQLAARNAQMRPMTLRPQQQGHGQYHYQQQQHNPHQQQQPHFMSMRPRYDQPRQDFSVPPPLRSMTSSSQPPEPLNPSRPIGLGIFGSSNPISPNREPTENQFTGLVNQFQPTERVDSPLLSLLGNRPEQNPGEPGRSYSLFSGSSWSGGLGVTQHNNTNDEQNNASNNHDGTNNQQTWR